MKGTMRGRELCSLDIQGICKGSFVALTKSILISHVGGCQASLLQARRMLQKLMAPPSCEKRKLEVKNDHLRKDG